MTIYFPDPNRELPAGSFSAFIRDKISRNWVLARRTSRIVARYGDDVVCLSPKKYKALDDAYQAEVASRSKS